MPARKPKPGESFGDLFPEVAKEWHPTKNGDLNPFEFLPGSNKKVWWKCPKGDDHEWETYIKSRTTRISGCSVCHGKKVVLSNCLATTHPKIAKDWHTTKNGVLTSFDVTAGSSKKVWWKCSQNSNHDYEKMVFDKVRSPKCLKCNSLAVKCPELLKEWHPTKNGDLNPELISFNSGKKVWWKCGKGDDHEWKSSPNRRQIRSCPICSGHKVVKSNCLATVRPDLAREWHPTKNNLTTKDIFYRSSKKFWWKCDKGDDHIWEASVKNRDSGARCSICYNKKTVMSTSLSILFPEIAKEWHPTKNGKLTPFMVNPFSHKKVWWKCYKEDNHEWTTTVGNRQLSSCPYCTLTPQSKEELIITHELITIFKGINPKGFKTRVKGKLRSIDIYIPDLKLGIEFDGNYWHKDKRALDKLKTEELEAEGFNIIRVRQKPLKRIFEDDVMAEKKYDGKKITNDILIQIMKDYKLGKSTILKISKYIKMPNLQNEKGLEKYIDMILTEKANKTNTL